MTPQADHVKERTALVSLTLDLVLIIPSVIVAIWANSMILYADLLGDLNVFIANVTLWMILRKLRKAVEAQYDYGLGKAENLIGVFGALFVVLSVGFIMYTSVQRLLSPVLLEAEAIRMGALIMFFAMIAYAYLWWRNLQINKTMPSPVTDIQWRVPMSNTLIAGGILVALLATILFRKYRWSVYIDPVLSLAMGLYILYCFFGLIKSSLFDLLDRTLDENYQLLITGELAAFFHEYEYLHGVRSRRTGGKVFIEIFLEFDADRRVGDVQHVIDAMKKSLEEKIENSSVSVSLTTKPVR